MSNQRPALTALDPGRFETPAIMKQAVKAHRALAELKGIVASVPNPNILIQTLGLREAKDSSEIENIFTTHDELYRELSMPSVDASPAAKEVARYSQALNAGFDEVRRTGLLTTTQVVAIQAVLEQSDAGIRKLPGTILRNDAGSTVYTPPSPELLPSLLTDLDKFINDGEIFDADPLVKMALMHHQFESIHPFYDGNGRTGRIMNVLYLVKEGLLEIPVLYLSRGIVRTKSDYFHFLQSARDEDRWEDWAKYMLEVVEATAEDSVRTITDIRNLMLDFKHRVRKELKFYSQDLINNLFRHPYTRIEFIQNDLGISRVTAAKYLDELSTAGYLTKRKIGNANVYVNDALFAILSRS